MLTLRKASERGHADHGWLDTYHSFSFADYFDEAHMGFRALRVINEDFVRASHGFPTHGHRDMEILTYVLAGELEHKDSLGTGSVIRPGEVQYMSAGSGVRHSEINPSRSERLHLLQIWILPSEPGAAPRYGQKDFSAALARGGLVLVASPDGAEGSLSIRQDVRLFAARVDDAKPIEHVLARGRHAWIQVARGSVEVNGQKLAAGDGLAVSAEPQLTFANARHAEFLVFDLA